MVLVNGNTHQLAVDDAPVTIGRSPSATICLSEEGVSRQHCVVSSSHGRLLLLDQGSTNGTTVNGRRVSSAKLSHGDVFQVGTMVIRVQARTEGDDDRSGEPPSERPIGRRARPPLPHEQVALIKRLIARLAVSRTRESAATAVAEVALEIFPARYALLLEAAGPGLGDGEEVVVALSADGTSVDEGFAFARPVIRRVIASGRAERHLTPETETLPSGTSPLRPDDEEAEDRCLVLSKPVLCAPIRHQGENLGVLYLQGAEMPDWVGDGDSLSLLSTLGDLAGLALGSAHRSTTGLVERAASGPGGVPADLDLGITPPACCTALGGEGPSGEIAERLVELGELTEEQRSAVEELKLNLERHVEARAEVIEEQRIELAARLAELEHLQRARATMSRGLVHDIRNLVAALQANLSFVRIGTPDGSEEACSIEAALVCARRITSMADDVLAVARMEQGNFPLELRQVSVIHLFSEILSRHGARAREDGVELRLGAVRRHLHVLADAEVLSRVLDNLVDNGLRYARDGFVELQARNDGSSTELIVLDSGAGVDPEQRDRIFDEWVQAGGAGQGRHHGFGLYFCRLAVEAHGGAIRVEGRGGDNRFVVSLPSTDDRQNGFSTTEVEGVRVIEIPED